MTIERAIELLQTGSKFPEVFHTTEEVDEVCQMAIAALNAQKNLEPYAEADQKGRLYILPPEHSVAQCLDLAKQVTDMGLTMQQALDIFRAQQKQPNEPLTYEQLQQMDGEPVYITGKHLAPSWDIVAIDYDHDWPIVYFHYKYRGALQRNGYGKTWRAYRRKPEQEESN